MTTCLIKYKVYTKLNENKRIFIFIKTLWKLLLFLVYTLTKLTEEMSCYNFKIFNNKLDAEQYYEQNKNICEGGVDDIRCYVIDGKYL